MDVDENGAMSSLRYWSEPDNRHEVALYTTPPAAQPAAWAGLTDDQYETLVGDIHEWSRDVVEDTAYESLEDHARKVLAKHGIAASAKAVSK